jgi:hypothetical protein
MIPVVYTVGKVSSTTISESIEAQGVACLDLHVLAEERLNDIFSNFNRKGRLPRPHHCQAAAWRHKLLDKDKRNRFVFITLFRDPIERNLSSFFHNLQSRHNLCYKENPAELFNNFLTNFPHGGQDSWIRDELWGQTGIDVLKAPFDKTAMYGWDENQRLLVFRTDCPNTVKETVLSDLLGKPITLTNANEASAKDYRETYAAVKALARFNASHLDRMYDTPLVRHLWTEEEIAGFRRKWSTGAEQ